MGWGVGLEGGGAPAYFREGLGRGRPLRGSINPRRALFRGFFGTLLWLPRGPARGRRPGSRWVRRNLLVAHRTGRSARPQILAPPRLQRAAPVGPHPRLPHRERPARGGRRAAAPQKPG